MKLEAVSPNSGRVRTLIQGHPCCPGMEKTNSGGEAAFGACSDTGLPQDSGPRSKSSRGRRPRSLRYAALNHEATAHAEAESLLSHALPCQANAAGNSSHEGPGICGRDGGGVDAKNKGSLQLDNNERKDVPHASSSCQERALIPQAELAHVDTTLARLAAMGITGRPCDIQKGVRNDPAHESNLPGDLEASSPSKAHQFGVEARSNSSTHQPDAAGASSVGLSLPGWESGTSPAVDRLSDEAAVRSGETAPRSCRRAKRGPRRRCDGARAGCDKFPHDDPCPWRAARSSLETATILAELCGP